MKHVVSGGEKPADICKRYTGSDSRGRVTELVDANLENVLTYVASGTVGSPRIFDENAWHDGIELELPESWCASGQVGAPYGQKRVAPYGQKRVRPMSGMVGQETEMRQAGYGTRVPDSSGSVCNITPLTDVKEYRFLVRAGQYPDAIAREWLGSLYTGGVQNPMTTRYLLRANYDKAGGFVMRGANCEPQYWNEGDLVKIPKAWPDPPDSLIDQIRNTDGSKYEPGDGTGGGEGGEGIDQVKWFGEDSSSSAVWIALAVGAAALGGVLLVGAAKKKGG